MDTVTLQRLHDLLDDVNAEHGYRESLCLFCKSTEVNTHVGIANSEDCVIQKLRKILSIW